MLQDLYQIYHLYWYIVYVFKNRLFFSVPIRPDIYDFLCLFSLPLVTPSNHYEMYWRCSKHTHSGHHSNSVGTPAWCEIRRISQWGLPTGTERINIISSIQIGCLGFLHASNSPSPHTSQPVFTLMDWPGIGVHCYKLGGNKIRHVWQYSSSAIKWYESITILISLWKILSNFF